ncbi:unnamed protein product [Urochloa decumbens]|uniref:KIB1-4 beta-propeller domain-containing protein n=1 Tax=Urochloa decumbens TaxID=240449 RepID=A0ABC9F812_9POAL
MSDQRKKEHRDWAALPEDIVDMFAGRLDCNVDRANMAMQCQSWRDTVGSLPERIQLPWMLVPVAANCVVASLVTSFDCSLNHRTLVAFHRFGASAMSSGSVLEAEDIIYYRGSFYCLTMIEDMIRCTPCFSQDDPPDTLVVRKTYLHFAPIHHDEGLVVKARYLVESRGQLLMVVRFKSVTSEDTSMFAFFQMVADGPDDGVYFVWQRLAATGGRMIFVGHGASRCFEASVYPSCKEGVYYLDDETFNQAAMVAFGFSNGRSYSCHDNGYWPGPDGEIKRSYDWRVPSSYTPPIWFLH